MGAKLAISEMNNIPQYLECLTATKAIKFKSTSAADNVAVLKQKAGHAILFTGGAQKDKALWGEVVKLRVDLKTKDSTVVGHLANNAIIRELNKVNGAAVGRKLKGDETKIVSTSVTESFQDLVSHATELSASDIHIVIRPHGAEIKYRIHGYLETIKTTTQDEAIKLVRAAYSSLAVSSSKSKDFNANMGQQCAIDVVATVHGDKNSIRLRYQHMPATGIGGGAGLDVVLRIINITASSNDSRGVLQLGYTPSQGKILKRAFSKPRGSIIYCGETGSGKSTSLSVNLRRVINERPGIKTYTIEDPVEQIIPGATQVEVKRKAEGEDSSNGFDQALLAALRMDPDIIMLGEIRDVTSASLFRRVVDSGHQAVSTIHAASIIGIINRLVSLDIPRKDLAAEGFMNCLVSQTLVPILCDHCKVEFVPPASDEDADRFDPIVNSGETVYAEGKGCNKCGGRGYSTRTVCAQVVEPTPKIRHLLSDDEEFNASVEVANLKNDDPDDHQGASSFFIAWMRMRKGKVSPQVLEEKYGMLEKEELEALYKRFPLAAKHV